MYWRIPSLIRRRFGKLRLHGTIKVGKDCQAWQELECFLFSEMLICVKEKKINPPAGQWTNGAPRRKSVKCTLKGSILIKKHLKKVSDSSGSGNYHFCLLRYCGAGKFQYFGLPLRGPVFNTMN